MKTWGLHMIIDCAACNDGVLSKDVIDKFARDLVELIDMKAYGEPQVHHFAEHDEAKAGWSLVQLIETSAITGHFCDSSKDAYIDIFSCKDFDTAMVCEFIEKVFAPTRYAFRVLERQAPAEWKPGVVVTEK